MSKTVAKRSAMWRENHPERSLLVQARARAKRRGTLCTVTEADIIIPEFCPVLGIPLFKGKGQPSANSPSLDELRPGLGYVPGNIQVISVKANVMKSDATPQELLKFSTWVRLTYGA